MTTPLDELLTVEEVAQVLKVPKSWIYEHTKPRCRDPLPYIRLGKYLRFVAADVVDYMETLRMKRPVRR